jgi:hypothetical protein
LAAAQNGHDYIRNTGNTQLLKHGEKNEELSKLLMIMPPFQSYRENRHFRLNWELRAVRDFKFLLCTRLKACMSQKYKKTAANVLFQVPNFPSSDRRNASA